MLDGLLGRGFAPKCKSLIKLTKRRIEVIRRKRIATLKILKKDMADLLANGLDINAYGRAEGLLNELTKSSCYDFVELNCDFVLKHLSVMQKLRHCPEDCRQAVSSLMFAAARFSDLPELCYLRDVFYERYGSYLEVFVNQEFIEKLSSNSFTTEKKVQIMQDMASEFSIGWESSAFEKRMFKLSAPAQVQPKIYGSLHINEEKLINGKDSLPKVHNNNVSSKERHELAKNRDRLISDKESHVLKRNELSPQSRHEVPSNGCNPLSIKKETILEGDSYEILFQGRQEYMVEKHQAWKKDSPPKSVRLGSSSQRKRMESVNGVCKLDDAREIALPKRDGQETLTREQPDRTPSYAGLWSKNDGKDSLAGNSYGGQHGFAEEAHKVKPYYHNFIPPYTKPNAKPKESKYETSLGTSYTGSHSNVDLIDHSGVNRFKAGNGSDKIQQGAYYPEHERQSGGLRRLNGHGRGYDDHCQEDGSSNATPKPRSSRRRHSKSHFIHDSVDNMEGTGVVKRRSRSRRRDERSQNDEEKRIDELLMYYSTKPSSYEPGRVRRKTKSHLANDQGIGADKSPPHISKDGQDEISEMVPPPHKSISLPRKQTAPSERTKVFKRSASFQPDMSSTARHVHPKLPDYDDLAARFAVLKGR